MDKTIMMKLLLMPILLAGSLPAANAAVEPVRAGWQEEDTETESRLMNLDKMEVQPPKLQALVSINKALDPYRLDATGTKQISLREVLQTAVNENLDIRIRQEDIRSKNWTLFSSYAQFLPNINLGYRYQYLKGSLKIPLGADAGGVPINSPFIFTNAGFTYYAYRGGKIFNTALQNRNYARAARHLKKATLSDILFEACKLYDNLLLSEALLEIRIRAVETSEAQLSLNQTLLDGGKATKLDVLQARTQLATDKQRLIDQQIARRNAAIELSELLNMDQATDLLPSQRVVQRRRLLSENAVPAALLKTALTNRPELKQFKELWLASQKTAKINAANLQPNFQFFGQVIGLGETLSNSSETVSTPISLNAVNAGSPTAVIQRRISRQITPLYTLGYSVNWSFNGIGMVDLGNIESARAQSRQSMLELNRKVNSVTKEVRESYLRSLSSDRKLEETMSKVDSAAEELRLAQMRFRHGVGKNIDVLKAQEDLTSALVENAEAIVDFNIAQAQVLRDMGVISIDHLLAPGPLNPS